MMKIVSVTAIVALVLLCCQAAPAQATAAPAATSQPTTSVAVVKAGDVLKGKGTDEEPLQITAAPGKIAVDGDAADWAGVPKIAMPFMDNQISSVRFCWSADGLYGLAEVKDDTPNSLEKTIWKGDCVEVWVERDCARALDLGLSANASQFLLSAAGQGEGGKGAVEISGAGKKDDVICAWKKTARGYTMEFLIPAKMMAPAKMEAGAKIGFTFSVDDDGAATEQYSMDKNKDEAYRSPNLWGVAVLAK